MRLGTIFKVSYNPNISPELRKWIRFNITPSMGCGDEVSYQYNLDRIVEELKRDKEDNTEDYKLLTELQSKGVVYIEF